MKTKNEIKQQIEEKKTSIVIKKQQVEKLLLELKILSDDIIKLYQQLEEIK